ncbi:MAG: hypothetical protein ACP5RS_03380 [Thermoplasmata archaeon]
MTYPEWVLKHRTKGTQVRMIGNGYYLYKVHSIWNKEKKSVQLKTDKYLGKITPDGIIPPKYERVMEKYKHITSKEYGSSWFLYSIGRELLQHLKEHFSNGDVIFTMAALRLLHSSPLKNMEMLYETSYFSDVFDIDLSPKILGDVLRDLGMDRESIVNFLKTFITFLCPILTLHIN